MVIRGGKYDIPYIIVAALFLGFNFPHILSVHLHCNHDSITFHLFACFWQRDNTSEFLNIYVFIV